MARLIMTTNVFTVVSTLSCLYGTIGANNIDVAYVPKGPKFSWDTIPVFFHSSNASGPYTDEAIEFIAKSFPMVTIEKFQGPCGYAKNASPACHQESLIVAELKRVKTVNPNVSAIFYYNSVLDFPQYDLHGMMLANPSLMLHNENGEPVTLSGGGHDCDVFDFGNADTRQIFIDECVNATKSGFVDGCFLDRAVDGTPTDSIDSNDTQICSGDTCRYKLDISNETLQAYFHGHIKVLTDLQTALGEGPLIANHAYGPPHDDFVAGSVNFAMIEGFGANVPSIQQLQLSAKNGRGVQAHAIKVDEDSVAAFLIGAGYRAFLGTGGWGTADPNAHWHPVFAKPLGAPLADATLSPLGVYSRSFGNGIHVTFDSHTNKGNITGWGPFPPPPSPPSPPSPPPSPPVPPVTPTATCPVVTLCSAIHNGDVKSTAAKDWATCCADCTATKGCTQWCYTPMTTDGCHLHNSGGTKAAGDSKYCGLPHNATTMGVSL
eukprot:m.126363 g.126363  ORF g.126363 m.126363 type:complete len:490 (-) comp29198_c2_seq1:160-1629(-)